MNIGEVWKFRSGAAHIYHDYACTKPYAVDVHQGNHFIISGRPKADGKACYGTLGSVKGCYAKVADLYLVVAAPPPHVKTKRDRFVWYLEQYAYEHNPDRRQDYIWGAAGTDVNHDGDPEWDCSGLYHSALAYAGVHEDRTNADGYKDRGVRLGHNVSVASLKAGYFAVLLRDDGTAHHIIPYCGGNVTIEARGAAYGIERHDTANVNARGGVWYHVPKYDAILDQPA